MYAILSFVSCGVGVFYSFALTTMLETYILSGQNLNDAMLRYTAVLIRTIISNRINLTYLLKKILFLEIVHILLIVTQPPYPTLSRLWLISCNHFATSGTI